jgi:hypothetical protein
LNVNLVRPILLLGLGTGMVQTVRLGWTEAAERRHPLSQAAQLHHDLEENPRLSSAWITLGIEAERVGDPSAEKILLEAARVDHQFLPAWTLANFYFRRGETDHFWPWAKRAAALTFDDYRPLLRLCDRLDPHPSDVITRLEGGPPLLRAYLDLLNSEHRPVDARAVARLLRAYHDPADQTRLAAFDQD